MRDFIPQGIICLLPRFYPFEVTVYLLQLAAVETAFIVHADCKEFNPDGFVDYQILCFAFFRLLKPTFCISAQHFGHFQTISDTFHSDGFLNFEELLLYSGQYYLTNQNVFKEERLK